MYAIFLKTAGRMVKLADCKIVATEQEAQWYCIMNPQCTYKRITQNGNIEHKTRKLSIDYTQDLGVSIK